MASTPNFNWATPDNTGLVKNGALDIRTLGNSIDASLVDLKGGTTGQVLAKATNTDMDFSWVAQDDSNAIQNAIVDAKGDLIAATANDTPARLAVGADDLLLTAASGEATGLKYTGGWTAFTPTFSNLTVGNGTLSARYCKIGKLLTVFVGFKMGSTSVMGNTPSFVLPILPSVNVSNFQFTGEILDPGVSDYLGCLAIDGTNAFIQVLATNAAYGTPTVVTSTVPMTWATNDGFQFVFSYEVA